MAKVLLAAPLRGGAVPARVLDLLGGARELADQTEGAVAVIALGDGADRGAPTLIAHGADEVLICVEPTLETAPEEAGVVALAAACRATMPAVVLLAADSQGRAWAPRLAWRLRAGLITEVTGWGQLDGQLTFTRQVFGGKAQAVMASRRPLVIATVKPGAASARPADPRRQGTVRELGLAIPDEPTWPRVTETISEVATGPRLEDATIIVSGGRGLGGPENFAYLQELADVLGAAVGASRAAVDSGWVPATWQIGQTGKSVAPNLYIAVGISGASQHMVGCSRSRIIVAINTNQDAPIFEQARLGVVGDYREVLPHLTAILREMRQR